VAQDFEDYLACALTVRFAAVALLPTTSPETVLLPCRQSELRARPPPDFSKSAALFRATCVATCHRLPRQRSVLEHAQEMAAHESPRTTKLFDRTKERLTQDEVERIRL
jgi:hypothetical protein